MNEVKSNSDSLENFSTNQTKKFTRSILIVGGVLLAIGAGYLIHKNKDSLSVIQKANRLGDVANIDPKQAVKIELQVVDDIPESVTELCKKVINNGEPFGVNGHTRNLSNGRKVSIEKIAKAAERGMELKENQTWVDSYCKNSTQDS